MDSDPQESTPFFFRPAIGFVNRRSFLQKIGLIALGFAIPLFLALALLFSDLISWENFTNRQMEGLPIEGKLTLLLEKLQQFRGMSNAVSLDPKDFNLELGPLRHEIDALFQVLQPLSRSSFGSPGIDYLWREVKIDWDAIGTSQTAIVQGQSFQRMSVLIRLVLSLMREIGYSSSLLMEPEPENDLLVQSVSLLLPEISEAFGQFRGLGVRAVEQGILGEVDRSTFQGRKVAIELLLERLSMWMKRPQFSHFTSQYPELVGNYNKILQEGEKFLHVASEQMLLDGAVQITPKEFFRAATVPLNAIFSTSDHAAKILKEHFSDRLRSISLKKLTLLSVTLAVAFLGAYLIIGFYLSLRKTVDVLKEVAGKMINGELTSAVPLESQDELGEVVRYFNQVALALQESVLKLRDQREELKWSNELLEKSLEEQRAAEEALRQAWKNDSAIAAEIQRVLLLGTPPENIPGAELSFFSIPSLAVDGDFYDFYPHSADLFDLVIADVMGKGVPAALIAAAAKAAILRALNRPVGSGEIPPLEVVVARVDQELSPQLETLFSFITLTFARFDFQKKTVTQINRGHPPLLHLPASRSDFVSYPATGGPIGIPVPNVAEPVIIPFESGDLFFFFSDGVVEPRTAAGEMFGMERLQEILLRERTKLPRKIISSVRSAAQEFADLEHFPDDFTAILIKIR